MIAVRHFASNRNSLSLHTRAHRYRFQIFLPGANRLHVTGRDVP
jgi:hypothetical protein